MNELPLSGKTVLITGSARRVGRMLALACAQAGADIIIHHGHSGAQAAELQETIRALGRKAWVVAADLNDLAQAQNLVPQAVRLSPIYALVNSAAIFGEGTVLDTPLGDWTRHLNINLTSPFLLSQAFARQAAQGTEGCIVNVLDWRALRPESEHFAYTVSKSALAAMTKSLAAALAPTIRVNGLALGAILPPAGEPANPELILKIPLARWGTEAELAHALLFLLTRASYITGEIIHLDGGRHLS